MSNWLTIVGIGEDGELGVEARAALEGADLLVGGARHLALVPEGRAVRRAWPSPMMPLVEDILAGPRERQVVVLASGDPMLHGVGATFAARLEAGEYRIVPQVSAFALACARLGWPEAEATLVSAVGKPLDLMRVAVQPGRRLALYGAIASEVAGLLTDMGYGGSAITVFDHLGGPDEARRDGIARHWTHPSGADLAVVAVTCLADADTRPLSTLAGLPDEAFESDGQMTKREVRAATLARLVPLPGQLLWDVGAGTGTIGIEWSRAHPSCRAIAIERRPDRAQRIGANARTLGVPTVRVIAGELPAALDGLPVPDAIFIGGGIGTEGLVERCWSALKPGGRLVANVVTVAGEAALARWHQRFGGDLTRISVARARPVGGMVGWKSLAPVTQWAVVKP